MKRKILYILNPATTQSPHTTPNLITTQNLHTHIPNLPITPSLHTPTPNLVTTQNLHIPALVANIVHVLMKQKIVNVCLTVIVVLVMMVKSWLVK